MYADPDLDRLARSLGDPTRLRMLALLMQGRELTAKELSFGVGVEQATGAAHLKRLLDDRLVLVRPQGRHRYYRLASADVAHTIEALMVIAPPCPPVPVREFEPVRRARLCYDHLAGRLAIDLLRHFRTTGLLEPSDDGYRLTAEGERWFTAFGLDCADLRRRRRKFAPACLDWSERSEHLGGAFGAALAHSLLQRGWLQQQPDSRVVTITQAGAAALSQNFAIEV